MKGLPYVCVLGASGWAVSMWWQAQEVLPRSRLAPSVHTGPASRHQHMRFFLGVFSLPTSVPSAVKGRREGWAIDAAAPNSHQPMTGGRWSINTPGPSPMGKAALSVDSLLLSCPSNTLPQSPTALVGKSTLCCLPSLFCVTVLTSGFSSPPTQTQMLVPELAFK